MAGGLPSMVYGDGIAKRTQVRFGGYNHTLYAGDGEIYDMQNMTSDHYPVLAPRKKRNKVLAKQVFGSGIFFADDKDGERHLYLAHGKVLSRVVGSEGLQKVGDLPQDAKDRAFATLGSYVIILPDKVAWDTTKDKVERLEAEWNGTVQIKDGKYKGEEAKANTIYALGAGWESRFKVGDAVEISGFTGDYAANNKTIIIREIEGDNLRFYENSFVMPGQEVKNITIQRTMHDMDFICENENRLWGCKGSTIYASKLGDPFNWNVFDGLSTDSFAADVGSAGDFTGCIKYLGYPCFFKEDHIYKVYGDRPANFQVMGSASLGVAAGSGKSLAIAGETLFYLSRAGIVAYSGGIPQSIAEAFGPVKYKNAVAGSDSIKYYVSMEDAQDGRHLFVYDTQKNMWHKELADVNMFAFDAQSLVWMTQTKDGNETDVCEIWQYGERGYPGITLEEEGSVWNFVEFGDFTDGDPSRKGTGKLQIRIELEEGASVTVKMQFDSDGVWHEVRTLSATKKKSFYLPIIPRRCDHYRVKIEGVGMWRLYSMTRESYSGSEL